MTETGCDSACKEFIKTQIKKRMQNQVGVSSSHYLDSVGAVNIFNFQKNQKQSSSKGVEIKHGSYARRLGKLKGQHISAAKNSNNNFSLVNVNNCC